MINPINTKRLRIREIQPFDTESIVRIIFKSKLWTYFGFESKPKDKELYSRMEELFKDKGWFVYSLKNTEDIIGWVFLGKTWMNTQIGYYIDREFSNNGYTKEATKAILNYSIKNNNDKKLEYIVGYVKEENETSQKILKDLGFQYSSTVEYQLHYYYL